MWVGAYGSPYKLGVDRPEALLCISKYCTGNNYQYCFHISLVSCIDLKSASEELIRHDLRKPNKYYWSFLLYDRFTFFRREMKLKSNSNLYNDTEI